MLRKIHANAYSRHLESIHNLLQLPHLLLWIVLCQMMWLLHVHFFLKIPIQKCGLDVDLVNIHPPSQTESTRMQEVDASVQRKVQCHADTREKVQRDADARDKVNTRMNRVLTHVT